MHKLFFDHALTPAGWVDDVVVGIEDGRISGIVPGASAEERRGCEALGGAAIPGVGNLHSHTFQRGFAGLTERRGETDDHFWTWRDAMYRLSAGLAPDDVEAIAAQAFVEMLESGFTGVAEFHYLHHQPDGTPYDDPAELAVRVAAAAASTGIGLTLLPVFYAHAGFGGTAPVPGQRRFVCDLDRYGHIAEGAARAARTLPSGNAGIAPHSLRAATGPEIAALVEAFPTGPVHIHIAEQTREVEDCIAATGERPVDWLLGSVAVDSRWCLIHATHVTPGEVARLAASGAVVGLCPITESDLGDGIFPAVAFDEAGGRYGVGSDSNVLIDLATELRTLEYSQRLADRARNRLAPAGGSVGRHLFDRALAAGAQARGVEVAALAPGSPADIVVLDRTAMALYGKRGDALLDGWTFAAPRSPVSHVFAAGRHVVRDGRHVARDAVGASYRAALDRLAARL